MQGTGWVMAALALLAGCGAIGTYDDGSAMVTALRSRLDRVAPSESADDAALRRFYERRRLQPAWTADRGQIRHARAAVDLLLRAGTHGLDPADYRAADLEDQLERLKTTSPVEDRAALEVDLSRSLLRFADHLARGRIPPGKRQVRKRARPAEPDLAATLDRAAGSDDPAAELEAVAPKSPDYVGLRHALARLRAIAAAGGWTAIPTGPPMSQGGSGPRVLALRHRLAAAGGLPAFDASLAQTVRRFQERHGLEPTGVVDEATLAELNVPVEQRIETVALNLERWRWMPRAGAPRYLLVNIPSFQLRLIESGQPALTMRIVVGKSWSPTPVFSDAITSVVLNPVWNVPRSITKDEIVPALRRDPSYLARHRMRLFDGDQEVDPGSVDGSDLERLSVRQDPGDQNALGKIKFLMPNEFDVYLHDTPAGHLFARAERDFSHGCIRVERPLDLATALLAGQRDWTKPRIEEVIGSGETTEVKLDQAVPVHITYFTAWAADGEEPSFGPDVYGLDRELAAALSRSRSGLRQREMAAKIGETISPGGPSPWL